MATFPRMTTGGSFRNILLKGFSILLLWTLVGLVFASQFYISSAKLNRPVSWWSALHQSLLDWYVFAVLSVPTMWLARRVRLDRGQWEQGLPMHLAGSIAFSLVYLVVRSWLGQLERTWAGNPAGFSDVFQPLVVKAFHFTFLMYWVIVGASHAFDYHRQAQEQEVRSADLERRLTEAKLQVLQTQINPHFLFNTLHGIAALMHRDVDAADRMLMRLSELLRRALDSSSAQEVALRQELEFLEKYLEIERTRFGARLSVKLDVAPETLDLLVPNLILQPLVENAIRHGIEPQSRPGWIGLTVRESARYLELEVRDNGDGLPAGRIEREGIGLANTRARLEQLYGADHEFEIANVPGTGLRVRLAIPRRAVNGRESRHLETVSETRAV